MTKRTKADKTDKPKPNQPTRIETRLVLSDTPHGQFLQFASVTVGANGTILAVDTRPQYVFESESQACHYAQSLFGATHAPVISLKRAMTTRVH